MRAASGGPLVRRCCVCEREIRECMGFTIVRDLARPDRRRRSMPRELCGFCVETLTPDRGPPRRWKTAGEP